MPNARVLTAKVRVLIDFLLEKIGRPPVWARETAALSAKSEN